MQRDAGTGTKKTCEEDSKVAAMADMHKPEKLTIEKRVKALIGRKAVILLRSEGSNLLLQTQFQYKGILKKTPQPSAHRLFSDLPVNQSFRTSLRGLL